MKEEILNLLKTTGKNFWSKKLTEDHKKFLDSIYYGYDTVIQCKLLIENKPRPECPICGGVLKMLRNETCSYKCRIELEKQTGTVRYKKAKETNIQKYGVENPMQSKEVSEKSLSTKIEKYGRAASPKQIESARQRSANLNEKGRKTILEKYGVINPSQIEGHNEKCKNTLLINYGVPHITQLHIDKKFIEIINDPEKFIDFIKNKTVYEVSIELGMNYSSVYNMINRYDAHAFYKKRSSSYLEYEFANFLNEHNISHEKNNRTILDGKEIDFYLPKYNIAIEMNGIYYHSDKFFSNKNYHHNKWAKCNALGIHLLSIFEDDWNLQNKKIKNMILSLLGKKEKGIPARKTKIKQIDSKQAKPFLEEYHLQGFVGGKHYGAFDAADNLIGLMTFGKTRNGRTELKRFVTDNYIHNGLFSKIFKYAHTDLKFEEIVSFSDNLYFTGNVYIKNGFVASKIIPPDYKYFVKNKRLHKSNYTKENIIKKYPQMKEMIESGMSESKAMEYLGIPKVWDCGKCEWIWKNKKGD